MFLLKNRDRIEREFTQRCRELPELAGKFDEFTEILSEDAEAFWGDTEEFEKLAGALLEKERREWAEDIWLAVKYLYCTMPCSDMGNYGLPVFLDYAVHGVRLWKTCAWVRNLPEEIFLNYVLHHRVNEEEIDVCRSEFYREILEWMHREGVQEGAALEELVQAVNFWCASQVSYHSSDARTASARTVYASGYGRCGEESVFAVNALRSIGIPARQVYAPRWSHCDDNHAWVEVWMDGTWYFLGACEPCPALNLGWFNGAASRAMIVHSRWFDRVPPEDGAETVIGREGMVTLLNQTGRYADTRKLSIRVRDEDGHPVPGAVVNFQVLNYAEFFTAASMVTDEQGCVCLDAGLGSFHIEVRKGNLSAALVVDNRGTDASKEQEEYVCIIVAEDTAEKETGSKKTVSEGEKQKEWLSFDMIAPEDSSCRHGGQNLQRDTTVKRKQLFDEKMARVQELHREKVKGWTNPELEKFLKDDKNKKLLEILSDKDQTDLKSEILEEHLREAPLSMESSRRGKENISICGQAVRLREAILPEKALSEETLSKEILPEDIYLRYVQNPRIQDEVLTTWRREIRATFTPVEQEQFVKNPGRIWEEVCRRITERPEWERSSIYTAPAAALRLGVASRMSKKILFVAIARTFGIPARLNQEDERLEFWREGEFHPVIPEEAPTAFLTLQQDEAGTLWKYGQNWTLSRQEADTDRTLQPGDRQWEDGKLTLRLTPGAYRILTSNRLPNGNQFAKQYDFELADGESRTVRLEYREAGLSDMLTDIAIPDFGLKMSGGKKEVKASRWTKNGYALYLWLVPGQEPTEHILNEMMEHWQEFEQYMDRIVMIVQGEEELKNPTLDKCLRLLSGINVCFHDFGEEAERLARRLYLEPGCWPLIYVACGGEEPCGQTMRSYARGTKAVLSGKVEREVCESHLCSLYGAAGYNVGTGAMVLRILGYEGRA